MTDVDRETVTRRLTHLSDVLADLEALGPITQDRLETDHVVRYAVERMLTLLVDTAVDVNSHVAARRVRPPEDARESFALAARAGIIDDTLARRLADSVGLRNVLTHEYLRVDRGVVADSVPQACEGYREYVRQVARAVR